jgi:hypothetical protein
VGLLFSPVTTREHLYLYLFPGPCSIPRILRSTDVTESFIIINEWGAGVSAVTRLRAGRPEFDSQQKQRLFSLLPCPDWRQRDRDVKLTTHLHLPSRLRMRGATPPLPHKSSRRGADFAPKGRQSAHPPVGRQITGINYLLLLLTIL